MTPAKEPGALPPSEQPQRPTPAALAGKRRPGSDTSLRSPALIQASDPPAHSAGHAPLGKPAEAIGPRQVREKRIEEISAGGLVIDLTGNLGLLIGRRDKRGRTLWSLPKGHIEVGETPEETAIREVAEETGITSNIIRSLGVIDFWFMADGKRIHKTVHHFLFAMTGGDLVPQQIEVDEVAWFPLAEIATRLAYSDERKLIASFGDIKKLIEH